MTFLTILFWTGLSILIFGLCVRVTRWQAFRYIPPMILAAGFIIAILQIGDVSYDTYRAGTRPLLWLLTPATIALAYPLYKNRDIIRKNKGIVTIGILAVTFISLLSAMGVGKIFGASKVLTTSMALKSVTTPIAIEISAIVGAIPEITACMVVFTGIFGGSVGLAVLSACGVRHALSIGMAMGGGSHVFGTARCLVKGEMEQAAVSVLAVVLVGICTAMVAPILFYYGW